MVEQWRLLYSGTVQGVGFRATVSRMAQNYPVSGYVRNLGDGRVELFAAGKAGNVEPFLAAVRNQFDSEISEIEVQPGNHPDPDPNGPFVIRY